METKFWKIAAVVMTLAFIVNCFVPFHSKKPKLSEDVSYVNLGQNIYEYTIKGNKYLVYSYNEQGGICPELPDKNK